MGGRCRTSARRRGGPVGILVAVAALAACSGSDAATEAVPDFPPLSLEDVAPAVQAVEAELGSPQRYTEINVQPDLVNLFVVVGADDELAYVYRDGELETPDAPTAQPPGVREFSLDGVALDRVPTFDDVLAEQLPESRLARLMLSSTEAGGLVWTATLLSPKGGALDVLLSPDGVVVGAVPR